MQSFHRKFNELKKHFSFNNKKKIMHRKNFSYFEYRIILIIQKKL